MAATPGISNQAAGPANLATYFASLPSYLLIKELEALPEEDQIRMALTYPQHFINNNRVNIFAVDAHRQLDIRTYRICPLPSTEWVDHLRSLRHPLLFDAILPESGRFSVDEIDTILNQYERVCIEIGIDPHAFLHSVFPELKTPPTFNGPYTVDLMSPLHRAVEAGRVDIIKHLIKRGANANQTSLYLANDETLTPFEYGLISSINRRGSKDFSTIRGNVEDAMLELAYTSTATAYGPDSEVTRQMHYATAAGLDRVACLFLQRFENLNNVDRTSNKFQVSRNDLLKFILTYGDPMPQSIRFMLDHGGSYRNSNRKVSMTNEAAGGHELNIATTMQWEIENQVEEFDLALDNYSLLATHDDQFNSVRAFANGLVQHNHTQGQSRLLINSITAGRHAYKIRRFLLSTVSSEVLDGVALRHAIRYRDREAVAFITNSMLGRGQSIDEPLPRTPVDHDIGNWFDTPLTYALAQESYFEAAMLLSLGASVDRIPPNIRHRVRITRGRISTGKISDLVAFVFRGMDVISHPTTALQEAESALNYVFLRLVDDPDYPIPAYVRARRHTDLPLDDPANDSEREMDPMEVRY
ncbi:hypothetical protein F4859DRAFT_512135 [Xylaria cf. heliscus]|nr:hypothetical protein F4859DRAFT_512135 [Xylaria cf. heliscus]